MIDAHIHILALVLFLLDEARSKTSAPRIDNGAAFFSLD